MTLLEPAQGNPSGVHSDVCSCCSTLLGQVHNSVLWFAGGMAPLAVMQMCIPKSQRMPATTVGMFVGAAGHTSICTDVADDQHKSFSKRCTTDTGCVQDSFLYGGVE